MSASLTPAAFMPSGVLVFLTQTVGYVMTVASMSIVLASHSLKSSDDATMRQVLAELIRVVLFCKFNDSF